MKKRKLIIGTIIALILIFILVKQIDLQQLRDLKITFDLYSLSAALLLRMLAYVVRSIRFGYILDNSLKLIEIFIVTCFYNLYTALLPGGLGELSFIYLIKKKIKDNVPTGLSTIVITRIFDIFVLASCLLLSLMMISDIHVDKGKSFFIMGAVIIITLCMAVFAHKAFELLGRRSVFFKKSRFRLLNTLINNLESTSVILKENKRKNFVLFFLSFLLWGINFMAIRLMFHSFGVHLSYLEAVLMGTISNFISIIPVNTIGGFGYRETGIALALIAIGFIKNEAIIYSFIFHLVGLAFVVLLAFAGFLLSLRCIHSLYEHAGALEKQA